MGGGVSTQMGQEQMTFEEMQKLFGSSFLAVHFNALRDPTNTVNKTFFNKLRQNGLERELFSLFSSHCPKFGELSQSQFVQFFVNTGLLKHNFKRAECDALFHSSRIEFGLHYHYVNFYLFLEVVIPEYCKTRQVPMATVLDYLSRLEEEPAPAASPAVTPSYSQPSSRPKTVSSSDSYPEKYDGARMHVDYSDKHEPTLVLPSRKYSVKVTQVEIPGKPENNFAKQLQRLARGNQARKRTQELKEVAAIRLNKEPVGTTSTRRPTICRQSTARLLEQVLSFSLKEDQPSETKEPFINLDEDALKASFEACCKPGFEGEMDKAGFMVFCRKLNLISKNYSILDAEMIFKKSIAKILSLGDEDPLKKCIFYEKRINFVVMRSVILVTVAQHKSMTIDELLNKIRVESVAWEKEKQLGNGLGIKSYEPAISEQSVLAIAYAE